MTVRRTPRMLRPLLRRDYRLLFGSLLGSLLTEGMWMVAVVWQVIATGGSASALSLVSSAAGLGLVLSTLAGGVLADRLPQQRILLVLELGKAAALAGIGVAVLAGAATGPVLIGAALVIGLISGLYYPAYSALVPRLVPGAELLAVNGYEAMVRPATAMALGPAAAAWIIAVADPGVALLAAAGTSITAAGLIARIRVTVDPATVDPGTVDPGIAAGPPDGAAPHPLRELAEGVAYAVRTPWLSATLLFASLMVLVVVGPMDVLIPFAIADGAHGTAADHSLVLAAYGIGGAVGAAAMAARPMPRSYLTVMMCCWGVGTLPMAVFGLTTSIAVMVLAGFLIGALFEAPTVVWGTLLQRRVPRRLLGRVSSLDFFVSLVFLPVSMALAGPLAQWAGLRTAFLIAALVPAPLALLAWCAARMRADEIAHPLPTDADTPVSPNVNLAAGDGAFR